MSSASEGKLTRKPKNYRLPDATIRQAKDLITPTRPSETAVIVAAVEELWKKEKTSER
jgi:hypothetical protein